MSLDPAFSSFDLSQTNVRLRKTLNPSESKTTISFYNEIESDTSSGIPITSTTIGSTNIGDNVFIESSGSILRAFNYQGGLKRSLGTVGSVDYTRGIITVDPFFNESFTLIIRTKNVNEIKAMNNTVLNIDFDLTLSSE